MEEGTDAPEIGNGGRNHKKGRLAPAGFVRYLEGTQTIRLRLRGESAVVVTNGTKQNVERTVLGRVSREEKWTPQWSTHVAEESEWEEGKRVSFQEKQSSPPKYSESVLEKGDRKEAKRKRSKNTGRSCSVNPPLP